MASKYQDTRHYTSGNVHQPEELEKFKSPVTNETTDIDRLKDKYKNYFYIRNLTLNSLEQINKKEQSEANKKCLQRTMAQLLNLETDLIDIWNKLEDIRKKQSLMDDDIINVPQFGTNTKIDFTGVQGLLAYDPTQATPTLYQVWESICEFTKNCSLTEKSMKTILSQKLKHEALDIYMLYKDYPVHKIIKFLKDRFGSFPTLETFEAEYDAFKRGPGESITTAMARYERILRQLHRQQTPEEIKQIIERDCKSMVKKIALPEAKAQLDREEMKAKTNGRIFSYKDRLNKILLEEQLLFRQKRGIPSVNLAQIKPDIENLTLALNTLIQHPDEHPNDGQTTPTNEYPVEHPRYNYDTNCHTPDEYDQGTPTDNYPDLHPHYDLEEPIYENAQDPEEPFHDEEYDQHAHDPDIPPHHLPDHYQLEPEQNQPINVINNFYISKLDSEEQEAEDNEEVKSEEDLEEETNKLLDQIEI